MAYTADDYIVIENTTMTGSDLEYAIPADIISLAFQASGGDIAMSTSSGGNTWTIADGKKESIEAAGIANATLFFNGTNGVILQTRAVKKRVARK